MAGLWMQRFLFPEMLVTLICLRLSEECGSVSSRITTYLHKAATERASPRNQRRHDMFAFLWRQCPACDIDDQPLALTSDIALW